VEVSTTLATQLAKAFDLQSVNIVINQNASSAQYLYFRYFLQGEPLRYMDVSIGIDQAEVVFSNPSTIPELFTEFDKLWKIILECMAPSIGNSYFEATLHCEADGVKEFLNDAVRVPSMTSQVEHVGEIHKGYSITWQQFPSDSARLGLDVSGSIQNGLYVLFAYFHMSAITDTSGLLRVLQSTLGAYRRLQRLAGVQLLERNADGSYSKGN
jgi:hypothetical protein